MEALYNYNIKIVEGNPFALLVPFVKRTFVSCKPIDEDINVLALEDVVARFGGVEYPAEKTLGGVLVRIPGNLPPENYDLIITATYYGTDIRAAYKAVTIVSWNEQSNAQQYVQGSPVALPSAFYIASLTDAELEQLKQDLREAIAAAEAAEEAAEEAKKEWERKAAELDGVAQESTLTQGVQDIREDISHIDIDTSDLAREATLGTPLVGQPSTIFAAIAAIAQGNDSKQAIVDAINQMGGSATTSMTWTQLANQIAALDVLSQDCTFSQSLTRPINIGEVMMNQDGVVKLYSTAATQCLWVFSGMGSLEEVELPNATTIQSSCFGATNISLKKISLPSVVSRTGNNDVISRCPILEEIDLRSILDLGSYSIRNNYNLRKINLSKCYGFGAGTSFSSCSELIDIITGENFNQNINIAGWSPTTALLINSMSLLTDEDIAHGFTNNREKLLYNIREHIAANMPSANYTITFSAEVKAAILADQPTADAFTNKGWTIA